MTMSITNPVTERPAGAIDASRASVFERMFRIRERRSTPGVEILAGATTFATMAFVLVVNPIVMSAAGMDREDLTIATALAAAIGSLFVAFIANRPLVAAPAMGSNIVFASVLVGQLGFPWQAGLAMVFLTGAVFLLLSLSRFREKVVQALPSAIQVGIQASVGILIIMMALRSAHVIVRSPGLPAFQFGTIITPAALLALSGMLLTQWLVYRRMPGALLLSIAVLSVAGLLVPGLHGQMLTPWPQSVVAWPHWPSHTALKPDFAFIAQHLLLCAPLMVYFFCSEFFSTLGTVIGASGIGGLAHEETDAPGTTRVFVADALATMVGPLLGTAVVTVFVESAAGIQVGGRTGLTTLTAAILFLLSLFFGPVLMAIPAEATAPAMLAVGLMMLGALRRIDPRQVEQVLPVGAALLAAILSLNLLNSIAAGTGVLLAIETMRGRARAISSMLWAIGALFAAYYLLTFKLF